MAREADGDALNVSENAAAKVDIARGEEFVPFATRVARLREPVLRALRATARAHVECEDALHEGLASVLQHETSLCDQSQDELFGYAFRAARWAWLKRIRRAGRQEALRQAYARVCAPEPARPDDFAERREVHRTLTELVGGLPPQIREVVLATGLNGLSLREAAKSLGIAPGTAFTRYREGRTLLRSSRRRRGV